MRRRFLALRGNKSTILAARRTKCIIIVRQVRHFLISFFLFQIAVATPSRGHSVLRPVIEKETLHPAIRSNVVYNGSRRKTHCTAPRSTEELREGVFSPRRNYPSLRMTDSSPSSVHSGRSGNLAARDFLFFRFHFLGTYVRRAFSDQSISRCATYPAGLSPTPLGTRSGSFPLLANWPAVARFFQTPQNYWPKPCR